MQKTTERIECPKCDGHGYIRLAYGMGQTERCVLCNGSGVVTCTVGTQERCYPVVIDLPSEPKAA